MTLAKALQAAAGNTPAGDLAAAIDFDGTNDYLSRSSDLTGNTDSKTFTFSCWFYVQQGNVNTQHLAWSGAGYTFQVSNVDNGGSIHIDAIGTDTTWPPAFYANVTGSGSFLSTNTWNNLLISIDLTSTSTRKIVINDVDRTSSTDWYDGDGWYRNIAIDFTRPAHNIGSGAGSTQRVDGRLSNVFLDYTYRDLSVEANRRLFITADGQPADGQAALNPIMYMPLDDPEDIGYNAGTGGDFTVNGVMARSGRGPNQDNCSASTFDGTADYLTGSPSGMVDGGIFSGCVVVNPIAFSFQGHVIKSNNERWGLRFFSGTSFEITGHTSGGTQILDCQVDNIVAGKLLHISFSFDLSNTSKRHLFVNGVDALPTYSTYTSGNINFTNNPVGIGARPTAVEFLGGSIGELYFNTTYIDLATSNPFWDSDLNKPVSVRKVIEDTGVTPLIALPIIGSDAGNNLGTGGDFTVNSGPYPGARGASEFWARSAQMLGTNTGNYLNNNSISGLSAGKTFTLMVAVKSLGSSDKQELFHLYNSSNQDVIKFTYDLSNNGFYVNAYDSARNLLLSSSTLSLSPNVFNIFLISINLASRVDVYVNGTAGGNLTIESNANIDFPSIAKCYINAENTGSDNRASQIASLYFSTSYIDFSQEANRLKFVDGLGYPVDLQPAIDAGDISTPLIHMKFDDTSALGTNSGTGGDFTINGTVTSGADVSV